MTVLSQLLWTFLRSRELRKHAEGLELLVNIDLVFP